MPHRLHYLPIHSESFQVRPKQSFKNVPSRLVRVASVRVASVRVASVRVASVRVASVRVASVRVASVRVASIRVASVRVASVKWLQWVRRVPTLRSESDTHRLYPCQTRVESRPPVRVAPCKTKTAPYEPEWTDTGETQGRQPERTDRVQDRNHGTMQGDAGEAECMVRRGQDRMDGPFP
jgi:hypothetical protein